MKRFLASLVIFFALASAALATTAFAQGITDKAPEQALQDIFGKSKSQGGPALQSFSNRVHDLSANESGADILTSLIFTALDFLKYVLGTVAVIFAIITGVKLVTAGNKAEEEYGKTKNALKYILFGLILVIISDELVTNVFFGDFGECLKSAQNAEACSKKGSGLVKGLYSFALAIMASVSIFMLVYAGFRMATYYHNEEVLNNEKKHILYALAGLIIAGVAEFLVKGIIFPDAGTRILDIEQSKKLIGNLTNFTAGFIASASFVMLLYGGYLYVASFGNDDLSGKAKKVIFGAVIGMLVALMAFGAVQTITTLTRGEVDKAGETRVRELLE